MGARVQRYAALPLVALLHGGARGVQGWAGGGPGDHTPHALALTPKSANVWPLAPLAPLAPRAIPAHISTPHPLTSPPHAFSSHYIALQYDWFCDQHRAALSMSQIKRVRQVVSETQLVSEFEVSAGTVPFIESVPIPFGGIKYRYVMHSLHSFPSASCMRLLGTYQQKIN